MEEAKLELETLREFASYYSNIGFDILAARFTKAADTIENLLYLLIKGETNGKHQNGNDGDGNGNA